MPEENVTPNTTPSQPIQPQTNDWPKPDIASDNIITRGLDSEPLRRPIPIDNLLRKEQ